VEIQASCVWAEFDRINLTDVAGYSKGGRIERKASYANSSTLASKTELSRGT
jgi:hypothetical protein